MGGSCSAGRGIHPSDDLCIIEPVDAGGNPVRPGERAAKLYLTNLDNRTQPLIRCELTDEVTVLDEPCPCGTTLLRIDDVQGRLDDCFAYPGGPTVHPLTFRSALGRERNIVGETIRRSAAPWSTWGSTRRRSRSRPSRGSTDRPPASSDASSR